MDAALWPYGKCAKCTNKNYCGWSNAEIVNCMNNDYQNFSPITKADSFRAMSDEELAGVFWELITESVFVFPFKTPSDLLAWLKSPVEENE